MDFTSDNICGVNEEILSALSLANAAETAAPYGVDGLSMTLDETYSSLFGRPAHVVPVSTGTAANALALSTCVKPWEAIVCHENAHINTMECAAPEFLTGGAKILPVSGTNSKITIETLEKAIRYSGIGSLHRSQVACLSLTQTTDCGTIYSVEEWRALTRFAKEQGLKVHVDGARFANAVAQLGCTPGELVEYVDVLSLGASKNGTMNVEALIFFTQELATDVTYRLKQTGHLVSKSRFQAAQLLAYVQNDLWLKNARHANHAAQYLAQQLSNSGIGKISEPIESNMIFWTVDDGTCAFLRSAGVGFYATPVSDEGTCVIRFVCGFDTSHERIDQLIRLVSLQSKNLLAA